MKRPSRPPETSKYLSGPRTRELSCTRMSDSLDADTFRGLCYLGLRDRNRIRNRRRSNMTRFRWWLAGLVMLALPASVAIGQSAALATVALVCPMGHEAAQTQP